MAKLHPEATRGESPVTPAATPTPALLTAKAAERASQPRVASCGGSFLARRASS